MRFLFRNPLSFGFALSLAALVASALVARMNFQSLADGNRDVVASQAHLAAAERVLSTLKDAETGQRGFIITGDASYLGPYEEADRDLPGVLAHFSAGIPANDASRVARCDEIRSLSEAKRVEVREMIDIRKRANDDATLIEAATRIRVSGRGKEIMDKIRGLIGAVSHEEQNRLVAFEAVAQSKLDKASLLNAIAGGVGGAMVCVAFYLFRRDLAARELVRAALQQSHDELERRVRDRTVELSRAVDQLRVEVQDRIIAEEKVTLSAQELRRSNRELEEFASVASHDLQEPLRKIQQFGDRLEKQAMASLGEQGRDYLKRMLESASRMSRLISDLLTYSRVATKAKATESVDLAAVAREVVGDLEARLHQSGGRVELGDLPTIEAEPLLMRQLLQNLIGNALKFHRPGVPPVVRVAGSARGDDAELTVIDNGIGFEEKYLDRIFTVFQRLHGRNEYEGTGMGLAIVRKIVEQHGGKVSARSRPGEGSTFAVVLPTRRPQLGEST